MQERPSSASSTGSKRQLTSDRVAQILKLAIIPALGANKLDVIGQGNPYIRDNGTAVRIFNVQAFASNEDAEAAGAHWNEGTDLEEAGDIAAAQEHYKEALNQLMSFSVLEENAAPFVGTLQVQGRVEEVEKRDGTMTLGFNNVRPVQVVTSGANRASLFVRKPKEEEKEELPATDIKATAKAGAKAGAAKK